RRDVVAVDLGDREAEGAPFVGERLEVLNLASRPRRLHLVVVDDRREVRNAVLAGAHRRLPHRALVDLAVAGDDEDARVARARARSASAMPRPTDRPWPSAPVEASTPGTLPASGWPPRIESRRQNVSSVSSGKNPLSASTA